MSKIKILHIIKSLGRGGAETLLPETLKLHDKTKFDFHYIFFLPWKDQMAGELRAAGGKVTNFSASNNLILLMQFQKVKEYCMVNDIDLIHCHLPWSGFLGRTVYGFSKIPVIYTEHNIQERYHFITRLLNKGSFNFQSMALGVSEGVTQSILKNIHPKIPVATLLNGVDTKKFKRDTEKGLEIKNIFGVPANAIVVGNIAVFREQKNLRVWVRAFKKLTETNENIFGLLVGAGPEEKAIKDLAEDLNIRNKIKFAGLQTDTVSYFSAMDIFMMSSDFEGLPVALLEAMSMECAVISTMAGGVIEVIEDGQNGYLCEVGNWEALAKFGEILVEDKKKRNELKKAARMRIKEAFSLDVMVRYLEGTYKKILNIT